MNCENSGLNPATVENLFRVLGPTSVSCKACDKPINLSLPRNLKNHVQTHHREMFQSGYGWKALQQRLLDVAKDAQKDKEFPSALSSISVNILNQEAAALEPPTKKQAICYPCNSASQREAGVVGNGMLDNLFRVLGPTCVSCMECDGIIHLSDQRNLKNHVQANHKSMFQPRYGWKALHQKLLDEAKEAQKDSDPSLDDMSMASADDEMSEVATAPDTMDKEDGEDPNLALSEREFHCPTEDFEIGMLRNFHSIA